MGSVTLAHLTHIIPTCLRALQALAKLEIIVDAFNVPTFHLCQSFDSKLNPRELAAIHSRLVVLTYTHSIMTFNN